MKLVKKTAEYAIYQKRNNRYGVKNNDNNWVNGDEKVKVLLAEGFIKATEPKAPEPEVAEEPAAEVAEEATAEDSDAAKESD